MANLPYTRVVNVNLTRLDNFPSRRGFGVPLILSSVVSDVTTDVAAATPVKTYGTMQEVAADWGVATEAYKIANTIFSQNPTPLQIKIGYCDSTAATAGMDLIEAYDDGWYSLVTEAAFKTAALGNELATWIEARAKILLLLSDDANIENAADATNVAAVLKAANFTRSAVFYVTDMDDHLHAATAAYMATRNFDDANSAYTMKFKEFAGIPTLDRGSAVVQAITGFVPGTGLDGAQGHFANCYVNIGGAQFLVEGSMADGGFLDEMHFQDWIVARTQEELLGIFTTNASIPYTDVGINTLVQGVQAVMGRAKAAGLVAPYANANGDTVDWELTVPRVSTVAASQRRQRIAPAIQATFRYAGAVHYATVSYEMRF